jgi:hypothetical protein
MNLSDEIRKQIEKNKGLKLAVGEINNHLSTLENLVRKDIMEQVDEAYQRGLEDGKKAFDLLDAEHDSEYQRGLDDAWECAKKLFSTMAESDIEKAFPFEWNNGGFNALMNLQPQEAIERLKSYEDDKIKRGDIVNVKGSCNDDLLGVVTKVWEDNCYIMWGDGSGGAWSKDSVVKTGKHIDVDKFFEEIAT